MDRQSLIAAEVEACSNALDSGNPAGRRLTSAERSHHLHEQNDQTESDDQQGYWSTTSDGRPVFTGEPATASGALRGIFINIRAAFRAAYQIRLECFVRIRVVDIPVIVTVIRIHDQMSSYSADGWALPATQ